MIIYNVTTKVHSSIAEDWLLWLQEIHMPEVMNTGCFTESNILRLLEVDDSEGPTYAIQYKAASREAYDRYLQEHSEGLRRKTVEQWGEKMIAFRSLMGIVH